MLCLWQPFFAFGKPKMVDPRHKKELSYKPVKPKLDKYENVWCCASSWRPHKRLNENLHELWKSKELFSIFSMKEISFWPLIKDRLKKIYDYRLDDYLKFIFQSRNFLKSLYHIFYSASILHENNISFTMITNASSFHGNPFVLQDSVLTPILFTSATFLLINS